MKSVVIIGAGPAGLTAAYELLKEPDKYKVTVLEESDKIGGISRTINYNGYRMDIGGHRFFSKDREVVDWWEKLMPAQGKPSYDDKKLGRKVKLAPGGPDPEKENNVMLVRNRVSRIYYDRKFFNYPITMTPDTFKNMGIEDTFKAGVSYLKHSVKKRPEKSLEDFYINRFGEKLYSMFFEGYTEKLWGRHPRDISAEWGAQRVKGLSVTAVIKDFINKTFSKNPNNKKVETSLIEEFSYPKYGPGQLWELTADKITEMGGEIKMNSRVTDIHISSDFSISSIEYLSKGIKKRIEGDIFISSMPVKDLILGIDKAPRGVRAIAKDLPYRDFVTVGILVNRLNLKNKTNLKTLGNIVPDCWIYVQDTGVKLGRIQIFNNWSPYMVKNPDKEVWIGLEYFCDENDSFWNMTEEECVDFAVNELISMNLIKSKQAVRDSHREKVKKAYPAYFDSYKHIDRVRAYLDNIENLYCVGRNGQHRYNNMDHSMATAFETVKNIRSGALEKDNIWNVNTEKEYHEEK